MNYFRTHDDILLMQKSMALLYRFSHVLNFPAIREYEERQLRRQIFSFFGPWGSDAIRDPITEGTFAGACFVSTPTCV